MNQVQKFLKKFFLGVGTDRASQYANIATSPEWLSLQKLSMDRPETYTDAWSYLQDAMCVELLRKCRVGESSDSTYRAAVAAFWESETQCAATNARLDRFINNQGPFGPQDEPVTAFIERWRKEIKRVFGTLPDILDPLFSSGSTLSDTGKLTTIPDKLSSDPTLYTGSYDILNHCFQGTILENNLLRSKVVRGNRFFTVPKDSEKDRGCGLEASGPMCLQLAVGTHLKARYRKVYKVDLRHAQQLHRYLAKLGSTGELRVCTIDLKSASDTVARKLVQLLLPDDWFTLLNSLRAKVTEIDGKHVYLEKFSSMGNGFTFELETIIFKTLAEVVGCEEAYVYGDDIIIPEHRADDLIAALRFFGFQTNEKKTFVNGPFRESCGGDYFLGTNVRALYMKELPSEPQQWVELANGLRELDPALALFAAAWWFCVDQVPKSWRNFTPNGEGVSFVAPELAKTSLRRLWGDDSHRQGASKTLMPCYRTMLPISSSFKLESYWKPDVTLAAALLGAEADVTPRNSVIGYRTGWVPAYGQQGLN